MKTKQGIALIITLVSLLVVAGSFSALRNLPNESKSVGVSMEAWFGAFETWLFGPAVPSERSYSFYERAGKEPYYVESTDIDIIGKRFDVHTDDIRHDFRSKFGGYSVWLNNKQVQKLQDDGYTLTKVGFGEAQAKPFCGDGQCKGKENEQNCPVDCSQAPPPPPPPPPGGRTCTPSGTQMPFGVQRINGGSGGAGVTIAVVDGGFASHIDNTNVVGCWDATGKKNTIKQGCDAQDGHMTHVTGTLAANGGNDGLGIYGVAPDATVLNYNICHRRGQGYSCYWDDFALAVTDATAQGANIISTSIAGEGSTVLQDAVRYASDNGLLVVAAAGNYYEGTAPEGTLHWPAAYKEVIAVGRIDRNDFWVASSRVGINDGDYIIEDGEMEFVAVGSAVESTLFDDCYATWSGTSMAQPHVAGTAAVLWQGDAVSTRAFMQSIAQDLHTPGDDPQTGLGIVVIP